MSQDFIDILKTEFSSLKTSSLTKEQLLDEAYHKVLQLLKTHHLLHIEDVPHPHPRNRVYRSEPQGWKIKDISSEEVFFLLSEKISKPGSKPYACVFDLDGTLFDVGYRTLGIIKEWMDSSNSKNYDDRLLRKLMRINYNHIGYSLVHAFENAGFNLQDESTILLFTEIEDLWKKKFFHNEGLSYDMMIEGAEKFVNKCLTAGIEVIYLSGRYVSQMKPGTLAQLRKFNFPVKENLVFLKEDKTLDDHVFKARMIEHISNSYEIIGNFENEYINLGHMSYLIKEALHIIVDSQHSGRTAPDMEESVYRLQNFK